MKLLYCPKCQDLFKLRMHPHTCICGNVKGAYKADGDHAWHNGRGALFGIMNTHFQPLIESSLHSQTIEMFKIDSNSPKVEIIYDKPRIRTKESIQNEQDLGPIDITNGSLRRSAT